MNSEKQKRRPNLVFVFTDQHSRDMLSCYGNRDIITPNLDAFARESVQFEHCVASSPVCTPWRGMLLSGQHPLHNGAVHNDVPLLADNGKYFGHVLTEGGYRTGYIGKWHLYGHERDRPVPPGKMRYGFDDCFLTNNCHVDYRPGHSYYWNEQGEKIFFDEWEVDGQTRQALEFLDTCSDTEPFALFVSWHPPHDIGIDPENLFFRYETEPDLMARYDSEKIRLRPGVADSPEIRRAYHGYYAMCTGVDRAFGRLMDKLKEKGLYDDTIIVFTSDHGDNLHSRGYRIAKGHPEDTAVRVPLLVRLPGGRTRRRSELLVGALDLMPTVLGLMDLPIPPTCQGRDLSGAILGRNDDAVESVPLFFHNPGWSGVYTKDYTYGYGRFEGFGHNEAGELVLNWLPLRVLYARRTDPHQLINVYDRVEYAEARVRMEELDAAWRARFGDPGGIGLKDIEDSYRLPGGRFPESSNDPGFRGRPIDVIRARQV